MSKTLDNLHRDLSVLALQVVKLFSDEVLVSILVRNPAYSDGSRDVLLTEDSFEEIREALALAEERPEFDHPDKETEPTYRCSYCKMSEEHCDCDYIQGDGLLGG